MLHQRGKARRSWLHFWRLVLGVSGTSQLFTNFIQLRAIRQRVRGYTRSCKTTSAQPTLIKMALGLQWLYVTLLINKHYAPAVPMKRARGRLNYVMLSKWWSSGPNICDVYIVRILTQATRLPFDAAGPSSAAVCRWKAEL